MHEIEPKSCDQEPQELINYAVFENMRMLLWI